MAYESWEDYKKKHAGSTGAQNGNSAGGTQSSGSAYQQNNAAPYQSWDEFKQQRRAQQAEQHTSPAAKQYLQNWQRLAEQSQRSDAGRALQEAASKAATQEPLQRQNGGHSGKFALPDPDVTGLRFMTDDDLAAEADRRKQERDSERRKAWGATLGTGGAYAGLQLMKELGKKIGSAIGSASKRESDAETSGVGSALGNFAEAFDNATPNLFQSAAAADAAYQRARQLNNERKVAAYSKIPQSKDFAANSAYNPQIEDEKYQYINDPQVQLLMDSATGRTESVDSSTYQHYKQMTGDERAVYNYIYNTRGRQSADEYLDAISPIVNERATKKIRTAAEDRVNSSDWAFIPEGIRAAAQSPAKANATINALIEYATKGDVDPNAWYTDYQQAINATNEAGGKKAAEHLSNAAGEVADAFTDDAAITDKVRERAGTAGNVLYGTGSSMLTNLFNMAYSGGNSWATLALMGTEAAADGIANAKARGLSDDRAIVQGMISGGIEFATEKMGIDALFDLKSLKDSAGKYMLQNILSEGAEEGASDVLNLVTDEIFDLLLGTDESEFKQRVQQHQAEGMDEKAAIREAWKDFGIDTALDVAGGALSGAGFGGGSVAINSVVGAAQQKQTGKQIQASGATQQVIDEALTMDESSAAYKAAQKLQDRINAGKKVSDIAVGRLLYATGQATEAQNNAGDMLARAAEEAAANNSNVSARTVREISRDDTAVNMLDLGTDNAETLRGKARRDAVRSVLRNAAEGMAQANRADQITEQDAANTINARPMQQSEAAENRQRDAVATAQNSVSEANANNRTAAPEAPQSARTEAVQPQSIVHNGDAAQVTAIESVSDRGDMAVTLDNGESVHLDQIDFEDPNMGRIYELAATLGNVSAAKTFIGYYTGGNATAYATGFMQIYNQAKTGAAFPRALRNSLNANELTAAQQQAAYYAGQNAAALENEQAENRKEINNGEETGNNVSDAGSERTDGQRAGKRTGGLAARTGEVEKRGPRSKATSGRAIEAPDGRDQSGAAVRQDGRTGHGGISGAAAITAVSEGIDGGTETGKAQLVPNDTAAADPALKSVVEQAKQDRKNLRLFQGTMTVKTGNGSEVSFRGAHRGNDVWVRADDPRYTAAQIYEHEMGHDLKETVDSYYGADGKNESPFLELVRSALAGALSDEDVKTIMDEYAADHFTDKAGSRTASDDYIFEEMFCDAKAGMNGLTAESDDSAIRAFAQTVRQIADQYSEMVRQMQSEAQAGGTRFSVKRDIRNRPFVEIDRDILQGVPQSEWIKTVKENLRNRFPGGVTIGRESIAINAQSRRELTWSNDSRSLYKKDLATFADKLRATDNADEILQAAGNWTGEGLNHPRKDRITEFARGQALIKIGSNGYSSDVIVATREDGSLVLYDIIKLTPVKITEKYSRYTDNAQNELLRSRAVSSNYNMPQSADSVKEKLDSKSRKKNETQGSTKFSMESPVEESNGLVAVHNQTGEELQWSLDRGGFPMPSIAVLRQQQGHTRYGDVSVVFARDTIDPEASHWNKVYGGDAWTRVYPQIDYKPSETVMDRIRGKYYDLSRKIGYDNTRPMYKYAENMEDQLSKHRGESAMLKELYNDTGMMQLFLEDTGRGRVESIQKENRSEMSADDRAFTQYFIDGLGEDVVRQFEPPANLFNPHDKMQHRRNFVNEHSEQIRRIYEQILRERLGFSDEDVQAAMSDLKAMHMMKYMRDALYLLDKGGVTVTTEYDANATENAIRQKADPAAYKAWIDQLFKGVQEKTGIRNKAEIYTRNGNRRSFEALHYEDTLENVVRAMREQNQTGNTSIFSGSAIWGVAAKDYKSVAEMKRDAGRLQTMPEEEYNRIKEGFGARFQQIAQSVMDKRTDNPFIALDNAMEIITDALRESKTKDKLLRSIKQYLPDTTMKTVVQIVDLVRDISEMPTEYFEAKPMRAVSTDEIKAVILPEGMYNTLESELADRGVPVVTYEYGNDADRLRALNSDEVSRFRFSLVDTADADTERVERDNKQLQQALDTLSASFKGLQGYHTSQTVVDKLARKVLKDYASDYSMDSLKENLRTMFDYIADADSPAISDLTKMGVGMAKEIVQQSKELDTALYDNYADARAFLKNNRIILSDTQRGEAKYLVGSYGKYRNKLFGKVRLVSTDGMQLDQAWQRLSEMNPELFAVDANEGDQVAGLLDAVEQMKPQYINPYGYDIDGAAYDLFLNLFDQYYDMAMPEIEKAQKQAAKTALGRDTEKLNENAASINTAVQEFREHHADLKKNIAMTREEAKSLYDKRLLEIRKESVQKRIEVSKKFTEAKERGDREAERRYLAAYKKLQDANTEKLMRQRAAYTVFDEYKTSDRRQRMRHEETLWYRSRIEKGTKELSKWLMHPTEANHVPEVMRNTVYNFLESIDFSGKYEGDRRATEWLYRMQEVKNFMDQVDSATIAGESDIYLDVDPSIVENVQQLIEYAKGSASVMEMDVEQLKLMDAIITKLKAACRNVNTIIVDGRRQTIDSFAGRAIERAEAAGYGENNRFTNSAFGNLLTAGNIKPVYFFRHIGGAMQELFEEIRAGQTKYAFHLQEAKDYYDKVAEQYHAKSWLNKPGDTLKMTTTRGDRIELTRDEALALYAISKREEANQKSTNAKHLALGGFVFNRDVKVQEIKNGKTKEKTVRYGSPHPLNGRDMAQITAWLTDEQRSYADALVRYMSKDLSALGNEVSMKMTGVKRFTEQYYFPYKSSRDFIASSPGQNNSQSSRILHKGFTKATIKKANNPIVLQGFTEVFGNHVNEMLMYNAMAIPQENLIRVYNYKTGVDAGITSTSVKVALQNAYGTNAKEYVDTFLEDLNGGIAKDPREQTSTRLLSGFKRASVMANLSVAIQQPSAIVRAAAMINPKYFVGMPHKGAYAEAKQYAGTAIIKDVGGFDTSTGRGAGQWVTDLKSSKRVDRAMDIVNEAGGFLPNKMDEITWGAIWEAVKREVRDTTDFTGEELLQAAGRRFDDVIEMTQVYDSVITRSQLMRSKSGMVQMATAFMAEPTVTYNMLYDMLTNRNDNKLHPARTLASVIGATVLNTLLKSIVYAARDDDDKPFLEKYVESVTNSLAGERVKKLGGLSWLGHLLTSELSPAGMIPYVRDVASIIQGYDVGRTDMSVISDLVKAIDAMDSTSKSEADKWIGLAGAIANLFGVPVKNVHRDIMAVVNTADNLLTVDQTVTARGIRNAVLAGMEIDNTVKTNAQDLYDAYRRGNTGQMQRKIDEISALYEDKVKEYVNGGLEKSEAEKKARSSVLSSCTSVLKPLYQEAESESERAEIRSLALRILIGHKQLYNGYKFDSNWK